MSKIYGIPVATPLNPDKFVPESVLQYTPQALTEEQKAQARANMGAAAAPEPIAYLYNGVELPPLPQRDTEAYPYAMIFQSKTGSSTYCVATSSPVIFSEAYCAGGAAAGVTKLRTKINEDSQWNDFAADENAVLGSSYMTFLWSNHDIYRADGRLYLEASEPVPVYPDSGGSGGVGLPYFALTATTAEMGQEVVLADEDRDALTSVLIPMATAGKWLPIVAAIPVDGIALTAVLTAIVPTDGGIVNYVGNVFIHGSALVIGLSGDSSGYTIYVDELDISGADTEAIAAELEAVIDGEY